MEESVRPEPALRRPGPADEDPGGSATPGDPPHLADPRALTILTTEHWGLLTARSLVYNEAFSRGGMFLTFMSASLVALGFVSQGAGDAFPWVVVLVLALDLVVGLATMGRLISASTEEFRALQGINRVRHAYLELVPGIAPYAAGPAHDDMASVLNVYGTTAGQQPFALLTIVHGLTTMPGLVGLLTAAVAGGLAATLALLAGFGTTGALLAALGGAVLMTMLLFGLMASVFRRQGRWLVARFPAPSARDERP